MMQCRVLGPVELAVADRCIPLASTHQRRVLALLLAAPGTTVSMDRLIHAVWEGAPPEGARKALHNHIARLRRTLADVEGGDPDLIVTHRDTYRIELAGHALDARRFEDLLVQARAADDPDRVAKLLDAALGLWRGPAFGELADHELLRAEATRLEALRAEAAANRIDALLAMGRHTEVIGDLEREVAAEPLRERPHAQLMLALCRAGRTADSLETFRKLQQHLATELGVDPAPELQRLHERILRQDPGLRAPEPSPFSGRTTGPAGLAGTATVPLPSSGARARSVMSRRGRLFGRETDVETITELLDDSALVTLTGPGGVGKSRLAQEVAADLAERFDGGATVVELAPIRDAAALDHAVAGALGVVPRGRRLRDQLVAALESRRLLLVVDNCEHLLPESAELVDTLLRRCPTLTVLATSRESLAVDGEQRYAVPPLATPADPADAGPDAIADNPAVQLFCDRAAAANLGFALTSANARAVAEICRSLDGVPLDLELAAARTAAMSVADLANRLSERFGLLTGGPRYEGGRHRALRTVVDWSYDLLDNAEACLFDRLSVFAGAFMLPAAEQVCGDDRLQPGDVARHLMSLVDKSMVLRAEPGYRLLATLRVYGQEQLRKRGEQAGLRQAHAGYFATLAEEGGDGARGPSGALWVQHLARELDNLRAAHRHAVDAGDADLALRVSAPLGEDGAWWLSDEVATWAEQAASMPGASGHALHPAAYGAAAAGAAFRGEFDHCLDLARRGLQAAPDEDDPRRMAPLRALSLAAIFQGRHDDSERLEAEIARHAEATGDSYRAIFVHIAHAMNATYRPDPDPQAAHAIAARACAEADALGNTQARAFAYYTHGESLAEHDPAQAVRWLEDSLALARTVPVRLTEAMALLSLSSIRARQSEPTAALATFRQAVELWRRGGDWSHQWTTLRNLVFLLTRIGQYDTATVLIGALDTTRTAAPSYGTDAERMRTTRTQLRERLGNDQYEDRRRIGAQMSDDEAAGYALAQIDALRRGQTQRDSELKVNRSR